MAQSVAIREVTQFTLGDAPLKQCVATKNPMHATYITVVLCNVSLDDMHGLLHGLLNTSNRLYKLFWMQDTAHKYRAFHFPLNTLDSGLTVELIQWHVFNLMSECAVCLVEG